MLKRIRNEIIPESGLQWYQLWYSTNSRTELDWGYDTERDTLLEMLYVQNLWRALLGTQHLILASSRCKLLSHLKMRRTKQQRWVRLYYPVEAVSASFRSARSSCAFVGLKQGLKVRSLLFCLSQASGGGRAHPSPIRSQAVTDSMSTECSDRPERHVFLSIIAKLRSSGWVIASLGSCRAWCLLPLFCCGNLARGSVPSLF